MGQPPPACHKEPEIGCFCRNAQCLNIQIAKFTDIVYYRQMCSNLDERYACIFTQLLSFLWTDFPPWIYEYLSQFLSYRKWYEKRHTVLIQSLRCNPPTKGTSSKPLILFNVTTSILVTKWRHRLGLSDSTLFGCIWYHFHKVNKEHNCSQRCYEICVRYLNILSRTVTFKKNITWTKGLKPISMYTYMYCWRRKEVYIVNVE